MKMVAPREKDGLDGFPAGKRGGSREGRKGARMAKGITEIEKAVRPRRWTLSPYLTSPPIMTIAYAGSIKLNKKTRERERERRF